ncbi:MAG: hypothetical protein ACE5G9_01035 [Nitrospinales bacterium]
MEFLTWTLVAVLAALAGLNYFKTRQLERQIILSVAAVNNLTFQFDEMTAFLETQLARAYYDQLQRRGGLIFRGDTPVDEALSRPGAREVLIAQKLIKKKQSGPFATSLAEQAGQAGISLERVLIALNNLEVSS